MYLRIKCSSEIDFMIIDLYFLYRPRRIVLYYKLEEQEFFFTQSLLFVWSLRLKSAWFISSAADEFGPLSKAHGTCHLLFFVPWRHRRRHRNTQMLRDFISLEKTSRGVVWLRESTCLHITFEHTTNSGIKMVLKKCMKC